MLSLAHHLLPARLNGLYDEAQPFGRGRRRKEEREGRREKGRREERGGRREEGKGRREKEEKERGGRRKVKKKEGESIY